MQKIANSERATWTYPEKTCLAFCSPTLSYSAAYYGLLRISETTGLHAVLAKDIQIGTNKRKILFILCTSKTDWKNNRPQLIKITSLTHQRPNKKNFKFKADATNYCPFSLLQEYIHIRGGYKGDQEHFFIYHDHSPIPSAHVRATLRKLLQKLRMDPTLYLFHGLRFGQASNLLKLGVSVETIKKLGRWRSNAFFWYLR